MGNQKDKTKQLDNNIKVFNTNSSMSSIIDKQQMDLYR